MSEFMFNISRAPEQYRPALRKADRGVYIGAKDSNSNGYIDGEAEILRAAKAVSKVAGAKFGGNSAQEAEEYLRAEVLSKSAVPPLVIANAPEQYQEMLKRADSGTGENSNNGLIDTEAEIFAATRSFLETNPQTANFLNMTAFGYAFLLRKAECALRKEIFGDAAFSEEATAASRYALRYSPFLK
ncbi:MAG: hypothetical protein LBD99_05770 [Candidatus Margulisbacteria bacterium]|jgi:hypothetical protein|nr:hypothetical protein [Candidatus Margulisiibacteriota bacterium]